MNLQVLASVMHQENELKLLEKMNIQSDAIIINQCDSHDYKEIEYNNNKIKYFSFNERGIGLSRNNALMRANNEIILFADEDVIYDSQYKDIIINEFKNNPKADMILFNLDSTNPERPIPDNKKEKRIRIYNALKYGTVRIAARTAKVKNNNISFSLIFGGGSKYKSGEDSLFIVDALNKGLKIYTSTKKIGKVNQDESYWFEGFNEEYFYNKGALFAAICRNSVYTRLMILQFLLRKRMLFINQLTMYNAYKQMIRGSKDYNKSI